MDDIKVKRVDLLDKLKANRTAHRDLFLKAQENYRQAVIEELDAMLAEVRANKRIRRSVGLKAPIDQTSDYDRAIAMLEMSVDELIDISERDFACYVLDQWSWAAAVSYTNSTYGSGGKIYDVQNDR